MNRWKAVTGLLMMMATLTVVPRAAADEAEDSFKLLFGAKYDSAVASASAADDLMLASEMLEAARTFTASPKMLALLCDRAYLLGAKDPDGYETAAAAMALLAEHVPARAVEANEKSVDIQQKRFIRARGDNRTAAGEALITTLMAQGDALLAGSDANGAIGMYRRAASIAAQIKSAATDELKGKLEAALAIERLEKQVAALRSKVLENAGDHESAQQLVKLLIIDMDNAALAQQYVNHVKDADLKKHMVLSAKPVDELSEADAQTLGVWYRAQAAQASQGRAKASALSRSAHCLERYLTLHTAEDLNRRTIKLTLEDVKKALAALEEAGISAAPAATPKVIRLFNGKDLTGWRVIGGAQDSWTTGRAALDPTAPTRFRTTPGNELLHLGPGRTSLATEASFGDCLLELEFMVTQGCNSGVFLMALYEIQIWDVQQKVRPEQAMGAIYSQFGPPINAGKPAGQWQKLVIDFRAPRFDKDGKKIANAKFVKVTLNGVVIHTNVEVKTGTNAADKRAEAPTGPLTLQGMGSPVAFRDINIKPLNP